MAVDLYYGSPEDHLMLPLPELWEAVRAIDTWSLRHAQVLDYIYQERLRWALLHQTPDDELKALHDHICRVASWASRRFEPRWANRWRGYADVIDLHFEDRQPDPLTDREAVLKRLHVDRILAELRKAQSQGLGQRELRELVGLKPANLTRVLNLMEHHELLRRESRGRENRLFLGRQAPPAPAENASQDAPPETPKAPLAAVAQRGMALLQKAS